MKRRDLGRYLAAAVAGMLAGSAGAASAAPDRSTGDKPPRNPAAHACRGLNRCKGQGGCKRSDRGCRGRNSCRGLGGCATVRHGCTGHNQCRGQGGCYTSAWGCKGLNQCRGLGACEAPVQH